LDKISHYSKIEAEKSDPTDIFEFSSNKFHQSDRKGIQNNHAERLCRSVYSEAEYNSLMKGESFSTVEGAMESKWLSTTIDDANQWGGQWILEIC